MSLQAKYRIGTIERPLLLSLYTYAYILPMFFLYSLYAVFAKEWTKFCFLMIITMQWDTWALRASLDYFFSFSCVKLK